MGGGGRLVRIPRCLFLIGLEEQGLAGDGQEAEGREGGSQQELPGGHGGGGQEKRVAEEHRQQGQAYGGGNSQPADDVGDSVHGSGATAGGVGVEEIQAPSRGDDTARAGFPYRLHVLGAQNLHGGKLLEAFQTQKIGRDQGIVGHKGSRIAQRG